MNNKYLVLSDEMNFPKDYDEYIIMGDRFINVIDWCKNNQKTYRMIPENWKEREKFQAAELYLKKIRRELTQYATEILNEYHHTCYTTEAWDILLSAWMSMFLSSYYDKFLKIKKFQTIGIRVDTHCYEIEESVMTLDFDDYYKLGCNDDAHSCYQYSRLVEMMDCSSLIRIEKKGCYQRTPIVRCIGESPTNIKEFEETRRQYKEENDIRDDVAMHSAYIKWDLYKKIMDKREGRITGYFKNYFCEVRNEWDVDDFDKEWRNCGISLEDESDEFVAIMKKLLRKDLPLVYVEHFGHLRDIARNYFKYAYKAKAVVFDTSGWVDDELHKVFLMELDPRVTRVNIQHGGGWGIISQWIFDDDFRFTDIYLSCGWEAKEIVTPKIERMPFIKGFRLMQYEPEGGEDILYVGYSSSKNIFRFNRFGINIDKLLADEIKFLGMLKNETVQKLRVRLYEADYGWNQKSRIQKEAGEFIYDTEANFYKSLVKSKLCISSWLMTTPLEALLCNKPILILEHPRELSSWDGNPMDEEIELLVEAGIIAVTPEKLAETVNEIYDDVDSWWNEPHRQEAIKRFKEKYLYFPENAEEIWIKRIEALADGRELKIWKNREGTI